MYTKVMNNTNSCFVKRNKHHIKYGNQDSVHLMLP
jgi:hypothetical protein